ncbi:hypothetical protein [Pseudomonas phage Alpheus]|uniref:Uncharacterized protein n=1 Tax=Pseudomonas phage Alpheus TaxID=2163983 RepID=A0A2S1GMW2_9CAUD|nr:hypothetical protein HOT11_gp07 [Pseudomonas phage Alpheus]AWD90731.1 hypothetical protein [Pseudomonas phage Alpheus]
MVVAYGYTNWLGKTQVTYNIETAVREASKEHDVRISGECRCGHEFDDDISYDDLVSQCETLFDVEPDDFY